MRVKKLSPEVRSKLQSGPTIVDATQCALELVENSLDAKATAIGVRINLKKYVIQVVDNGTGISPDDLNLVGKRYMSSKCRHVGDLKKNLYTYGYRGQALASLVEMCTTLTIMTKTEMSKGVMVKTFRNGKAVSISMSSKEMSKTGTTVTVSDFMSTMPVRRKRIAEGFDLHGIKTHLEYLAIIHNEVSFTLRDENKNVILLQTHKTTHPGLSFSDLFGLALGNLVRPLHLVDKNIVVDGFVSLKRHPENNLQFFYVNKRIVSKSVVHKFVNDCITKYWKQNCPQMTNESIWEGIDLDGREKFNVYVVQIQCPYGSVEIFKNLRKTTVEFRNWDNVLKCIKRAIRCSLDPSKGETDEEVVPMKYNDVPRKIAGAQQRRLRNGVAGGLVKRKLGSDRRQLSDRGVRSARKKSPKLPKRSRQADPESPIPPEHTLEVLQRFHRSDPPLSNTHHSNSSSNIDHWFNFSIWFKSKMKKDSNAYHLYSEFVQSQLSELHRAYDARDMDPSFGKRKSEGHVGGDQERKKLKKYAGVDTVKGRTTVGEINKLKKQARKRSEGTRISDDKTITFQPSLAMIPEHNIENEKPKEPNNDVVIDNGSFSKSWLSHYDAPRPSRGNDEVEILHKAKPSLDRTASCLQVSINKSFRLSCYGRTPNRTIELFKDIQVQTSLTRCDKAIQWNESLDLSLMSRGDIHNVYNMTNDNLLNGDENSKPYTRNTVYCYYNKLGVLTHADMPVGQTDEAPDITGNLDETCLGLELPGTASAPNARATPDPFTVTERYTFMPKGLSQSPLYLSPVSFPKPNQCGPSEESDPLEYDCSPNSILPNSIIDDVRRRTEENMMYYEKGLLALGMTKPESRINSMLNTFSISKEVLAKCKVIGQWDTKFIAAVIDITTPSGMKLLTLFDQHAVDERIRLEKLLREFRTDDGRFISVPCKPPVKCVLNESMTRLVLSVEEKLCEYGVKASVYDSHTILLHTIPACLSGENFKNEDMETTLKNLVTEVMDEIKETRGTASTVPKVLYSVISSKACRSAIKFQDVLSMGEMEKIMRDLSECQIPFQCAHGRPSVLPVLNLLEFDVMTKKKEKLKFGKFASNISRVS